MEGPLVISAADYLGAAGGAGWLRMNEVMQALMVSTPTDVIAVIMIAVDHAGSDAEPTAVNTTSGPNGEVRALAGEPVRRTLLCQRGDAYGDPRYPGVRVRDARRGEEGWVWVVLGPSPALDAQLEADTGERVDDMPEDTRPRTYEIVAMAVAKEPPSMAPFSLALSFADGLPAAALETCGVIAGALAWFRTHRLMVTSQVVEDQTIWVNGRPESVTIVWETPEIGPDHHLSGGITIVRGSAPDIRVLFTRTDHTSLNWRVDHYEIIPSPGDGAS
jgi:hypothetical protein